MKAEDLNIKIIYKTTEKKQDIVKDSKTCLPTSYKSVLVCLQFIYTHVPTVLWDQLSPKEAGYYSTHQI